jgi:O6-methylguanine-DNA--protein-cysteine methyltransferase
VSNIETEVPDWAEDFFDQLKKEDEPLKAFQKRVNQNLEDIKNGKFYTIEQARKMITNKK